MTLLATKPQCGYASKSCLDTWEIQPHRGCYKLVIRAIPDLGAPCLIESLALLSLEEKCFESQDYIYRRVGFFLLLSPFVALVRPPDVEVLTLLSSNFTNFFQDHAGILESFDGFVTRTLFLVPPDIQGLWQCPGELSSEVLSSQFYRCSSGIPEFRRHRNLFYAVVGEITSTPPSTGAGVREYCHNLYNECFSKVEVNDFRRFLGYVLTDGYSWIQGLLVWVIYFVSPVSPTPDCITRKFREFISGNSSSLRISFRQTHDMRLGFDVQWSAYPRLVLQWSHCVLKSPWLC